MDALDEPRLVRDFVNSIDVEEGTDAFADTDGLQAWLREHDLITAADAVTAADVVTARALRDGLRRELRSHHDDVEQQGAAHLDEVAAQLPLRVAFGPEGDPSLSAAHPGVPGALAAVLADVVAAALAGTWERLKICPADDCQWAFYDRSKNQSRRWCAMRVCGNRQKTRTYRQRRTAG